MSIISLFFWLCVRMSSFFPLERLKMFFKWKFTPIFLNSVFFNLIEGIIGIKVGKEESKDNHKKRKKIGLREKRNEKKTISPTFP